MDLACCPAKSGPGLGSGGWEVWTVLGGGFHFNLHEWLKVAVRNQTLTKTIQASFYSHERTPSLGCGFLKKLQVLLEGIATCGSRALVF